MVRWIGVLCLRCKNRGDAVPNVVMVDDVDIAENLKAVWEAVANMKYPERIYCDALKVVKVGDATSPAKSVTECEEFAEA